MQRRYSPPTSVPVVMRRRLLCTLPQVLDLADAHNAIGEDSPDLQPATHGLDHTLQRCDVHIGAPFHFRDGRLIDAQQSRELFLSEISLIAGPKKMNRFNKLKIRSLSVFAFAPEAWFTPGGKWLNGSILCPAGLLGLT
jgi:hypothetical protein